MTARTPSDNTAGPAANRTPWARLLPLAVTLLLVALVGTYLYYWQDAWRSLTRARPTDLACLVVLWGSICLATGYTNYLMYRALGQRVDFLEWYGLPIHQSMSSYFIPLRGAAAVTAVYMKKCRGLSYSRFVVCLLAVQAFFMLTTGPAACLLLVAIGVARGQWHEELLWFFGAVATVSWLAWLVLLRVRLPVGRLRRLIAGISEGWRLLHGDPGLIAKVLLLVWLRTALHGLRMFVAMRAVGVPCGPMEAGVYGIVTQYSTFFTLAPGNLGVQEAALTASSGLLGYSPELGMAGALLIRGVSLVMTFALGPVFGFVFARRLARCATGQPADGARPPSGAGAPDPPTPAEV